MTPWQQLGIAQSASKKDIKRAYASLIKEYRPDDSPVEFQQIREAYDHMLATLADEHIVVSMQFPTETQVHSEALVTDPTETESNQSCHSASEPSDNIGEEVESFISVFEALIKQFPANGKLSTTELETCRTKTVALIQSDILTNWRAREYLSGTVFNLLCRNIDISSGIFSTTTNMPNQFLHYLDRHFLWSENEIELREWCENDGAGLVFYCIHDATKRDLPYWGSTHTEELSKMKHSNVKKHTINQRIRKLIGR